MQTNVKRLGKLSLIAVALSGAVVALAAFGGHGRNMGRHMIQAHIDDVLDQLSATPAQRQQISAIETKVLDDVQAQQDTRRALMKELKTQIGSDTVNLAAYDQLVQQQRQAEDAFRADLRTAIQQTHDVLSPAQRSQFAQLKLHHGGPDQEQPVK